MTTLGPSFGSILAVELFGLVLYAMYTSIAPAIMSEQFPTSVRAVGIGTPYNLVVALLGGTTPYLLTWLQSQGMELLRAGRRRDHADHLHPHARDGRPEAPLRPARRRPPRGASRAFRHRRSGKPFHSGSPMSAPDTALHFQNALGIGRAIRQGTLTSRQAATHSWTASSAPARSTRTAWSRRARAGAGGRRRPAAGAGIVLGPLHGVPVAVKDSVQWEGTEATLGSQARAGQISAGTAQALRALAAHGMVILGKTRMTEFAFGLSGQNGTQGTARNPGTPFRPARRRLVQRRGRGRGRAGADRAGRRHRRLPRAGRRWSAGRRPA